MYKGADQNGAISGIMMYCLYFLTDYTEYSMDYSCIFKGFDYVFP